jgi:hypothetical protein
VIGHPVRRQKGAQQLLGLPQAHPHRLGGHGEPLQGVWADGDRRGVVVPRRVPLQFGDFGLQALDEAVAFEQPVLDLTGMVVDGLAATVGGPGLLGHRTVAGREDGRGIADPGPDG